MHGFDPAPAAADLSLSLYTLAVLENSFERYMRGIWKFSARAEVDGAVAAEAELMCTVKNTAADTK